jgi:hypothetical protein
MNLSYRRPTNFPAIWSHDTEVTANALGYPNVGTFTAAATLVVGDAVYINSSGKAAKSAVDANYRAFVGIVVGGASLGAGDEVAFDKYALGTTAATADQYVYVAGVGSIVYAYAGAAITANSQVGISSVSGRLDDVSSGFIFGLSFDSASADGDAVKILVLPTQLIGAGSGSVTGTGSAGKLVKWASATGLADSTYSDIAAVNLTAVAATGATQTTPYGYTQAQADGIITQLNLIIGLLIANGQAS